jgi:hypothetical protein
VRFAGSQFGSEGGGQSHRRPGRHDEDQIVIAAEVHVSSADFGQLEPMVEAAPRP